ASVPGILDDYDTILIESLVESLCICRRIREWKAVRGHGLRKYLYRVFLTIMTQYSSSHWLSRYVSEITPLVEESDMGSSSWPRHERSSLQKQT
ncbi:14191_t:CDS:2, partial [Acaulospora morrowiae]